MANKLNTNCPFTLDEYRALIKLAKQRFKFISYSEYKNHDSFIIWRHDAEYSMREMNNLAIINTDEGIKSTFFVQLHCNYYNLWDKENTDTVRNWIKWGHDIGLHFDPEYYGPNVYQKIEKLISFESKLLEKIFETEITSFAYHNPNLEMLKYNENYCGLINTYNKDFFEGSVTYVSDSNGRWRERTIRDVLEDENIKKVQVNTHDTWWTNERIPQILKLENAFRRNAEEMIKFYRANALAVVDEII